MNLIFLYENIELKGKKNTLHKKALNSLKFTNSKPNLPLTPIGLNAANNNKPKIVASSMYLA